MTDREKVIQGLECCLDYSGTSCEKCPYQATEEEKKHDDWDCHRDDLERDALELLKIQEPAIVKCKDCKYAVLTYQGELKYCKRFVDEYGLYGGDPLYLEGDFFCAYGERR